MVSHFCRVSPKKNSSVFFRVRAFGHYFCITSSGFIFITRWSNNGWPEAVTRNGLAQGHRSLTAIAQSLLLASIKRVNFLRSPCRSAGAEKLAQFELRDTQNCRRPLHSKYSKRYTLHISSSYYL